MPATTFSNGRSTAVEDVPTKAGETANLTSAVTRPEHDTATTGSSSGNGDHRSDPKHSSHKATNGAYENEDSDKLLAEPATKIPDRKASVHQTVSIFEHFIFKDVIGT